MADGENSKRRGRPPKGIDGDGQTRVDPVGAETNNDAAGKGLEWPVVNSAALKAEDDEGPHGRRITRVFYSGESPPELWNGLYSCAPVMFGPDGYCLSDGQVITV